MSDSSLRLHFRYGNEVEDPTPDKVAAAVAEVFHEDHPDLTEGDYSEHPNAWIQFGYENGDNWSLITLDVYRTGVMIYSFWDDQDDDEPKREAKTQNVTEQRAKQLFQLIVDKNFDAVAEAFALD